YVLATPVSLYLVSLIGTPPPEIYTLSLHDALPICGDHRLLPRGVDRRRGRGRGPSGTRRGRPARRRGAGDRPHRQRGGPLGEPRSEEHTSELQSREKLVCRLLLEKKKPVTSTDPTW